MRTLPYHADRQALLHPELDSTLLRAGTNYSDEQLCAEASHLAYKNGNVVPPGQSEVAAAFSAVGFGRCEFLSRANTQVYLLARDQPALTIVAFRGTEQNLGDFLTDLDAVKRPWAGAGQVHAGFADALEPVMPELRTWVGQAQGRSLLYTGHSLGAALATLLCDLEPPTQLVTFGSPLVGDATFVQSLQGKSFAERRYVDCCDLVTRIPPPALGFEHFGAPQYIDREGTVQGNAAQTFIDDDRKRAREDYLRDETWRKGTVPVRDLADHAPINYVTALLG